MESCVRKGGAQGVGLWVCGMYFDFLKNRISGLPVCRRFQNYFSPYKNSGLPDYPLVFRECEFRKIRFAGLPQDFQNPFNSAQILYVLEN